MKERERAGRLAHDLDCHLEGQVGYTEQTLPADRPLLALSEQLASSTPFSPTSAELALLRRRLALLQVVSAPQPPALLQGLRAAAPLALAALFLFGMVAAALILLPGLKTFSPGTGGNIPGDAAPTLEQTTTPFAQAILESPYPAPQSEATAATGAGPIPTPALPEPTPQAPQVYPTLPGPLLAIPAAPEDILTLLDRWQAPLRTGTGWVQVRRTIQQVDGNYLYSGLTSYTNDTWYQLNERGEVAAQIVIDRSPVGKPLQQSYTQDGQWHNLTFGGVNEFIPYPFDLAFPARNALAPGNTVEQIQAEIDGRPVLLLTVLDHYTRREVIDLQTGALLYSEVIEVLPGRAPSSAGRVEFRVVLERVQWVDAPPSEALALLEQAMPTQLPMPPLGEPAPAHFDPTGSPLSVRVLPGDGPDQPTFWYGDLYAGGYRLGRVDLGMALGACMRSPDGALLAFDRQINQPAGLPAHSLTLLDLRAIQQIYQPAPTLVDIHTLSWSPAANQLAIFGCLAENQNCGLYRLDRPVVEGATAGDSRDSAAEGSPARLLLDGVTTHWPVIWNPDGSQMAFVDHTSAQDQLYVVAWETGQVLYRGVFDAAAWQTPPDSPTRAWGVDFPMNFGQTGCFQ